MGEVDNRQVTPAKKRLLFLLEAFDKGGIEKVTLDIVNHLDPEKYDITVQTFWYGGHCQSLVNDNVKVIPFFFKRYVRGIIRLIEYLPPKWLYCLFVRGQYDVEIAASDGGAAKVISGSTNTRAKKICWVHMDVEQNGSKLKAFGKLGSAKRIYERFDKIVCVSHPCLESFKNKFGLYASMSVAENPLPDSDIRAKAGVFVPYSPTSGFHRFVSVGRLGTEKGYDRLVEACHTLVKQGRTNFCVHIIGDGTQHETLTESIQKYNLQSTVILEGFQSNPYPYVANADWFICCSRDEAYPLAVGESFLLHTPVVGTDCAGIRAWLDNGKYGIITENSTAGIVKAMEAAMDVTPDLYAEYKQKAETKAGTLDFFNQLKQWEDVMLSDA